MMKEPGKGRRRRFRHCMGFLVFAFFLIGVGFSYSPAMEEAYPNKPITLIVPFGVGGTVDSGSKIITEKMSKILGQPIISVHKPGGGGALGCTIVAKSKPDGYTLLAGSLSSLVVTPAVKEVGYTFEDFTLLGMYGRSPYWIAVKADARWKILKDLVEEAQKKPLVVATGARFTAGDFLIMFLNKHDGMKLKAVPHASTADAMTAVLGGHVDAGVVSGAGGLYEAGMVRILAIWADPRMEGLDVPTFKELGYPLTKTGGLSLCVPKGTPKEIVDKLWNAQKKVNEQYRQEVKEKLRKIEMWATYHDPEETLQIYRRDFEFFSRLAKEMGGRK